MPVQDLPKRLQAALLRIRGDHPFFGVLALFAEFRISEAVKTAATDGRTLWFNAAFLEDLSPDAVAGLVVHELLHAALQHAARRKTREPLPWNIAADIVVNGVIRKDTGYALPAGAIEDEALASLSVEEVYEQLGRRRKLPKLVLVDLLDSDPSAGAGQRGTAEIAICEAGGVLSAASADALSRHWRSALAQASAVARRMDRGFGRHSAGVPRELDAAQQAKLDWKALLWQYMVATPYDFGGFDRRFIHRGLYLEEVVGETVDVAICVDTSGSIDGPQLDEFMSEVQGILDAYPALKGTLFFADAELFGPFEFSVSAERPSALGGGGTSFRPFFRWLDTQSHVGRSPVVLYFTDGYGQFPQAHPKTPVMWLVSEGGLPSTEFPFGDVVRMGA